VVEMVRCEMRLSMSLKRRGGGRLSSRAILRSGVQVAN